MAERCVLIRPGEAAEGKTGVTYAAGVSASTAGARGLCLQLASLPPGARARAHLHADHESAAYVVEGEMVRQLYDEFRDGRFWNCEHLFHPDVEYGRRRTTGDLMTAPE